MQTQTWKDFVGQWHLVGRAETSADLMPDGSDGYIKTDAWLEGEGPDLLDTVASAAGLRLTIEADGRLSEEADERAKFEWFDLDGVLEGQAVPLSGQLVDFEGRTVLKTDSSPGANRYGDGDTTISESLRVETTPEHRLIRTVSIETDGIYGNRQVYIYSPGEE